MNNKIVSRKDREVREEIIVSIHSRPSGDILV
jgi:hypothetical protein